MSEFSVVKDSVRENWDKLMQHAATCGRCHPSWSVITLCPVGQELWFEFKVAHRATQQFDREEDVGQSLRH
jgi:hypothetical protein